VFFSSCITYAYASAVPTVTRALDAGQGLDDTIVVADLLGGAVEADLKGAISIIDVSCIAYLTYSCRRSEGGGGHDDGDECGELHVVVGTGVERVWLRSVLFGYRVVFIR
jgi:hypothetical protein